MIYIFWIAVLAAVVYGIVKAVSGDRYSEMTEKEFEEEAKRRSMIGAGVAEFQKVFDPSHHVEYIQEQDQRIEADGAESGDRPEPGSSTTKQQDQH
jgi:ABC-type bacteriocin/lantibiotic exporter with double-glycine peptidase domain